MPAKTFKMGPGTLILGETGTTLDLSCQLTSTLVKWDKDKDDDLNTLCGDTVPGDTIYTAQLSGTVLQDLSTAGVIEFTWTNKGTQMPFKFVPNTAEGKQVSGIVTIDPVDVGGDTKTRPTSDFEWDCVGEPTFSVIGV